MGEDLPEVVFSECGQPVKRIVERQETSATTRITHDLAEQQVLEELLETSKPGQLNSDIHYLLGTPFRYPPLPFGSRFGSTSERWIFYASLDKQTCLYECAYYRLLFLFDMAEAPPNPITTEHTLFSVDVSSHSTVDLRCTTYDALQAELQSVHSYTLTHRIGSRVRSAGGELLIFYSARGAGSNVAVFDERVFASRPYDQELWISQTRSDRVMFRGPGGVLQLGLDLFNDGDGRFPRITG